MNETVAVISAGTWGTTLAKLLADNHNPVRLHCHPAAIAAGIRKTRRNPLFLSEVELPSGLLATADLAEALADVKTAYMVVPTRYLREFIAVNKPAWDEWAGSGKVLCNCTKGLLLGPTQRTCEWLGDVLPGVELCHLAGPNFARELIRGLPGATTVAGPAGAAARIQGQLMSDILRVYTATDHIGFEVAGFYKNIIAIAAGACTELGLGNNARAALITRGLAEMGRLVDYFGGSSATLMGLAGVGDLVLTCSSEMSRNFQTGVRRARGQSLEQISAEMTEVAEGVQASRALHLWPAEHGLSGWPELPIAREVHRIVHENADPMESMKRLMTRPPKAE